MSKAKPIRTIARRRRRRDYDGFYHLRMYIQDRVLDGVQQAKDADDMRRRMRHLADNDTFWSKLKELDKLMRGLKRALPHMMTLLLFAIAGQAQTLSITGPTARIAPGAAVTVAVSLAGSAGKSLAALQSSFTVSPAVTMLTIAAGSAATAAMKAADCNNTATPQICLFIGDNQTAWSDGTVATLSFTMPATPVTISLAGLVGASAAGANLPITAPGPFTVSVLSCDVNNDGQITATDEQIENDVAVGKLPQSQGVDLNGDGVVNAVDAQRVANAKNGLGCNVGP